MVRVRSQSFDHKYPQAPSWTHQNHRIAASRPLIALTPCGFNSHSAQPSGDARCAHINAVRPNVTAARTTTTTTTATITTGSCATCVRVLLLLHHHHRLLMSFFDNFPRCTLNDTAGRQRRQRNLLVAVRRR